MARKGTPESVQNRRRGTAVAAAAGVLTASAFGFNQLHEPTAAPQNNNPSFEQHVNHSTMIEIDEQRSEQQIPVRVETTPTDVPQTIEIMTQPK